MLDCELGHVTLFSHFSYLLRSTVFESADDEHKTQFSRAASGRLSTVIGDGSSCRTESKRLLAAEAFARWSWDVIARRCSEKRGRLQNYRARKIIDRNYALLSSSTRNDRHVTCSTSFSFSPELSCAVSRSDFIIGTPCAHPQADAAHLIPPPKPSAERLSRRVLTFRVCLGRFLRRLVSSCVSFVLRNPLHRISGHSLKQSHAFGIGFPDYLRNLAGRVACAGDLQKRRHQPTSKARARSRWIFKMKHSRRLHLALRGWQAVGKVEAEALPSSFFAETY